MKTGPARFCQFTENRSVEFEIFKILRNFEIQNPKKLSFTLRILIKTEFKILLYFIVEKSRQVQWVLKLKKNHFDRFHRNLLFSSQVCFNTFNFILSILISLLL
jgi:hypothetical protein